ncbi:MAG: hypothetical protein ACI4L6_01805 [Candidatus Onthoplasma sp.]
MEGEKEQTSKGAKNCDSNLSKSEICDAQPLKRTSKIQENKIKEDKLWKNKSYDCGIQH